MKAYVPGSIEEILFVKGLNPGRYGCSEQNLEIGRETFKKLEKGEKVAYVSQAVSVAMHAIDCHKHYSLLNRSLYVYGKDYKIIPIRKFVENLKNWKEESFPGVKKITIIVAPPVRDEYRLEFKKAFQLESDILIFSAELPEKEEGFWSSDESPEDRAKLEEKWTTLEWWRPKLPKRAMEIMERFF